MLVALVTHDFSVSYVAQVGSRSTPLLYTIISLWSALEGSILFWGWVLSLYAALVVWTNRGRPGGLVPWSATALLCVSLFFAILLVGPANPFQLVSPVPSDGPGPNPLLQNHFLMAVHPPLLYLGYVGMTVPFAFAVGAMLSGEIGSNDWIRLTRRWTLLSWGFLSAAIIAGMWWSYEVLGWGGYWAWDPVENASFMPWLTATAFLHSAIMQERRGMLRLWNVNLVVGTFVLTILGTFLTRSGIVSSVHAFTTGTIGYFFLAFIALVLVAALGLVAGNSEKLGSVGRLDSAASRETVFLLNNLFLTVFVFTVLVGTLFPLVAEAIRGVKVSVGEPFFNRMSLPVIAVLVFLMGVGPALPWARATPGEMRRKLVPPVAGAALLLAIALVAGMRNAYALAIVALAGYSIVANVREIFIGTRARRAARGEGWGVALLRSASGNRRRFGGYVAHVGVFAVAIGIAASSSMRVDREASLRPGESITVAGRTLRLKIGLGPRGDAAAGGGRHARAGAGRARGGNRRAAHELLSALGATRPHSGGAQLGVRRRLREPAGVPSRRLERDGEGDLRAARAVDLGGRADRGDRRDHVDPSAARTSSSRGRGSGARGRRVRRAATA